MCAYSAYWTYAKLPHSKYIWQTYLPLLQPFCCLVAILLVPIRVSMAELTFNHLQKILHYISVIESFLSVGQIQPIFSLIVSILNVLQGLHILETEFFNVFIFRTINVRPARFGTHQQLLFKLQTALRSTFKASIKLAQLYQFAKLFVFSPFCPCC